MYFLVLLEETHQSVTLEITGIQHVLFSVSGNGGTIAGVCGKKDDTAGLQDLLVYNLKKLAMEL
ncbi:MAG: hypothetical protein PF441_08200 [Desulfuromusa sp.]|nr:hypothetical protein [Desulfuromusa sp.]